jgi:copper chaperone
MIRLSIPDMSCGHCEKTIREAVKEVDRDAQVTVDLNSRTVDIETARPRDDVSGAIAKAGYANSPLT